MFKKALLVAAVMSAVSINVAHAADGQIDFTGKFLATTCTIDNGDDNQKIAMGIFGADQVTAANQRLGHQPFKIGLTACETSLQNATVTFIGTADTTNKDLLKVDAATGVGIGLFENDGTPVKLGQPSKAVDLATNNAGVFNFNAQYVSTQALVTPGDANATADFVINYQ
ncbi:fimbrial protein [Pantoea sp.]|uniref:fimbrial protein n=1 Tax=Pantoea sp. TaxID=69393 RepID=UPI0031E137A3